MPVGMEVNLNDSLDGARVARPAAGRLPRDHRRAPALHRITGHYPVVSLAGRCSRKRALTGSCHCWWYRCAARRARRLAAMADRRFDGC